MTDYVLADKLLDKSKGQLFFQKGSAFLGALLCRMSFKWDPEIQTAQTNGETLIWNPDFFMSLDEQTRVTVLAHELWHVAFLHPVRGMHLDGETYNIAADHVINLLLKEHGYYMGGFPYVMDSKYSGWSTENIYDDLEKQQKAAGSPPKPCNGGEGGLDGDIIYIGSKGSGDEDKGSAMTSQQVSNMISKVVGATTAAKMSKEAGLMPGEITLVLENFLNPQLPWEDILFNFFNDMVEMERSYARPNRRYTDPILPGESALTGLEHLIYYLDISGSVTDRDILRFNSEVAFIHSELRPQRLTLVTFDTQIQDVYEFEQDDTFEKIVVTGRGGTDLHEVYKHAALHKPNAMIIFTDLYVSIPPQPPACPLVWICLDNARAEVPYGKLIHMTEDKKRYE
jgi:predicted metal-dependent peptidase